MEDEICQYSKYGFCKFKESCKRKHFIEDCKELSNCHQVKICPRRHPKPCKRFASGYCRFQKDCSYSHEIIPKVTVKCEHTETINILEKIVREITLKFIKVDNELKDVKEKLNLHEASINSKVNHTKETEAVSGKEPFQPEPETHKNETSHETSSESENKQESKKSKKYEKVSNNGKELLSCDKCEYQCQKENTLNKHRNTKHEPHECKVCGQKLPSMVVMLKHVADEHSKKMVQIRDIKEQNILKEHLDHKEVHDTLENDKFKCYKCNKIFLKADALTTFIEDGKNMCSLCTILSYGEN